MVILVRRGLRSPLWETAQADARKDAEAYVDAGEYYSECAAAHPRTHRGRLIRLREQRASRTERLQSMYSHGTSLRQRRLLYRSARALFARADTTGTSPLSSRWRAACCSGPAAGALSTWRATPRSTTSPSSHLSTRPNISESHSEISTRVPHCITGAVAGRSFEYPPEHQRVP